MAAAAKKRVLITGANGLIGQLLMQRLSDRFELIANTRRPWNIPTRLADITDFPALLAAFEGVDAVVHLAGDPHPGTTWESSLQNNIVGTRNVYEAAVQQGVGLVVYASSNHAVAWWEVEQGIDIYSLDASSRIDERAMYQPDSFYGFSKAAAEVLGRYYSDLHGLRVHCLRIGWVLADDNPASADIPLESIPPIPPEQVRERLRAIYLSHDDCAELVRCCLDADHVQYGIYYGISDNPRRFYELSNARDEIGYVPKDSAPR